MRPKVSAPTGILMGDPQSSTSCPLTRPSVPSIAIVLTVFSPILEKIINLLIFYCTYLIIMIMIIIIIIILIMIIKYNYPNVGQLQVQDVETCFVLQEH